MNTDRRRRPRDWPPASTAAPLCVPGRSREREVDHAEAELARLARLATRDVRGSTKAQAELPAQRAALEVSRQMLTDHRAGCSVCSARALP